MAQQDTGLGWSAKEEWLLQSAGSVVAFSEFGGSQFPGQPLPIISTIADLRTSGLYAGTTDLGGGTYEDWYIGIYNYNGKYSDCVAFGVYTSSSTYNVYFASSIGRDHSVLSQTYKINGNWSTFQANQWAGANTYDSATGLYYAQASHANGLIEHGQSAQIPIFSSIRNGLDAIQITLTPVYKLNAGYAVAALASWYGVGGNTIVSPVLISTEKDYALFSLDGTTETDRQLVSQFLFNGRVFYFSFIPDLAGSPGTHSIEDAILFQFGAAQPKKVFSLIADSSFSNIVVITAPDPYEEEGGGSGEDGGDGEDLEDDEMGISHHAIPAAINTGFCRIYCPSEQQLRDLSNFLWSAQYDLTAVKKLFANPMDSVLGLSAVPLTLSGANMPVYLGGVNTEMSFPMVSYQSYQVPMGAITVDKRWGSYLDYDPYTKFSIFLPFIGFKDLSADDIMGRQIILDYDVDILSGACTARLQAGANVLYQWSGQCAIQLPVTASNWNQVFQSATSAALSAGLAVATGSAGPVLAGALAAEGVQAIMGKPRIERGGTASGAAGWMGGLTPYLVRVTPEAIIPSDQNKFIGYPAFSSISLGALTGYNEISSIHLEGIPATGAELDELEAILKGGVIF